MPDETATAPEAAADLKVGDRVRFRHVEFTHRPGGGIDQQHVWREALVLATFGGGRTAQDKPTVMVGYARLDVLLPGSSQEVRLPRIATECVNLAECVKCD